MFTDDLVKNSFSSLSNRDRKRLCTNALPAFKDKYFGSAKGYGINQCGIDAETQDDLYYGFGVNIIDESKDYLVPDYFEVEEEGKIYLIPIKKTLYRGETHTMEKVVSDSDDDENESDVKEYDENDSADEGLGSILNKLQEQTLKEVVEEEECDEEEEEQQVGTTWMYKMTKATSEGEETKQSDEEQDKDEVIKGLRRPPSRTKLSL